MTNDRAVVSVTVSRPPVVAAIPAAIVTAVARRTPTLVVVSFAVDTVILSSDFAMDAFCLVAAHSPVSPRMALHAIDAILPAPQPARLRTGKIAGTNSALDSMLLTILPRFAAIAAALGQCRHSQRARCNQRSKRDQSLHDQTPCRLV